MSILQNTGPLYRVVAYDAVCFNGTEGLYFVSITQFCIVAFAMIMVTLRFAFKPGVALESGVNEDTPTQQTAVLASTPGTPVDGGDVGPSNDAFLRNFEEVTPQLPEGQEKGNTLEMSTEEVSPQPHDDQEK